MHDTLTHLDLIWELSRTCGWPQSPHDRVESQCPSTSPEFLTGLARHPNPVVRADVAAHPHTPLETLLLLAKDPQVLVRAATLLNPRIPTDTLSEASADPHVEILRAVASNTQTPADLLSQLAEHPDRSVRRAVAAHPTRQATSSQHTPPGLVMTILIMIGIFLLLTVLWIFRAQPD